MSTADNIRNALADISAALKEADTSGQPYSQDELNEIRDIQASLEARLQEQENQP